MTLNRTEVHRIEVDNSALDGTGVPVRIVSGGAGGAGDASAANQATEIASLTSIDGKLPALSAGRIPVVLPAGGGGLTDTELRAAPVPVSAAALPLPAGAATDAKLELIRLLLAATLGVDVTDEDTRLLGRVKNLDSAGAVIDPALKSQLPAALVGGRLSVDLGASIALALDAATLAALETIQVGSSALPTGASTEATQLLVKAKTDNLDVALSTRLKPADTLAAVTNLAQLAGTAPVMKAASTAPAAADAALVVGLSPNSPMPQPNTSVSSVLQTTANTAQASQINLAAPGAGLFHYLDTITITRVNNTAAAVAGDTTVRQITSGNLNSWAHEMASALIAGGAETFIFQFPSGLRSAVANTATTLSTPAGGAGTKIRITVTYRIGV